METITYGRQFFDTGYYIENGIVQKVPFGKAWNIAEYITELSPNYEIVLIYYADDVKMYYDLLAIIAEEEHWIFSLHTITQTKNIGIAEVNVLLEESILKNINFNRKPK